jgi:hypothetical protein
MNEFYLVLMALPLLFLDWQIALVWVFPIASSVYVSQLLSLPFEGLEVFLVFIAIGFVRRFIYGG